MQWIAITNGWRPGEDNLTESHPKCRSVFITKLSGVNEFLYTLNSSAIVSA